MQDLTPILIEIGCAFPANAFSNAALAPRPLVLIGRGSRIQVPRAKETLSFLLRYSMPVTGVIEGRLEGEGTSILLACDALLMPPRSSIVLAPSGNGEVPLLALRLGHAGASRVWFSGGRLTAKEALHSGWANIFRGTVQEALQSAMARHMGLSAPAIRFLRPLLLKSAGLPLAQAQALERAAFALAFDTGHPAEGIGAFLAKRRPRFGNSEE